VGILASQLLRHCATCKFGISGNRRAAEGGALCACADDLLIEKQSPPTQHAMSAEEETVETPGEELEVVETPGVAADNEAARFQVMKLLAEMEALDQEKARLQAMLELDQLKSMRASMMESFSKLEAMAQAASARPTEAAATTSAAAPATSPLLDARVAAPDVPVAPAAVATRPPRQSNLESRLAQLLAEEDAGEAAARESLRRAQTGTLQMLMRSTGQQSPASGPGDSAEVLPDLAADALAEARSDFAPDQAALTDSIARMEEALRVISLQRETTAANPSGS
jgi:hypothetical protein